MQEAIKNQTGDGVHVRKPQDGDTWGPWTLDGMYLELDLTRMTETTVTPYTLVKLQKTVNLLPMVDNFPPITFQHLAQALYDCQCLVNRQRAMWFWPNEEFVSRK